ncbi:MAG: DUF86 domain-containing protein [Magnetococcus sp. DMHC-1]|nr:DUF86 domain-containing protein [Magnetococcales bacterium]
MQDIIDACHKVVRYTDRMSLEEFQNNPLIFDAVVLNLLIVGEASKHLPDEAKLAMPGVEWSLAARFRNLVAHHYYTLDPDMVWDIVRLEIPHMETTARQYLNDQGVVPDFP